MMRSQQILDQLGADEWDISADGMLLCPCGRRVEDDGECPDGHVSPLRQAGMI